MPWDSIDRPRDEDLTEPRKWTRRLRKRGGRRKMDQIGCRKCGSTAADLWPNLGWLCGQCILKGGLHESGSDGLRGCVQENVAREE
jgi:hypothetical protein